MASVTEPVVVVTQNENTDAENSYTFTINVGEAGETETIVLGESAGTVTVESNQGVTVQGAVDPGSGYSPDPMVTIGGIAVAVGLILTIIAAVLINRALKISKPAAPITFSPQAASQAGDPQLIAAITASLMAYGLGGNGKQLVVRSVRRGGSASAWAGAGRQQQLNS